MWVVGVKIMDMDAPLSGCLLFTISNVVAFSKYQLQLHHLVITDQAVLKEAGVVKRVALHKEGARVVRVT